MGSLKKILIVTLSASAMWMTSCRQDEPFFSNVLKSDVFYQAYADHRYDFLWVMDNSDSMKSKRDYVKDNMYQFLTILNTRKAVDYQMAVVTTDFFTHAGTLVKNTSNLEVVKSTSSDPSGDFASIVNNISDSGTSFWEQGLESSYSAVYNYGYKFIRNGVPLVIIYVTDEDDYSCKGMKDGSPTCYGVQPENNPDWIAWELSRYSDYFKDLKKLQNSFTLAFPIVGLSTSNCTVAALGARYVSLQQSLGDGTSGSICSTELPASYEGIARQIADRGIRFKLSNQSTGSGIKVFVDQKEVPYSTVDGFYYEAPDYIVFTGNSIPKNGQFIEITYQTGG